MRNYLALICIMAGTGVAMANHLSPEQALARLSDNSVTKSVGINGSTNSLSLDSTIGNLYVFSSGEGFVLLPNDDLAPAVLAFSDTGKFEMSGNPELAYWLEYYNTELDYLKLYPNRKTRTSTKESPARTARAEIAPMLSTEWNQEAPYNELCPKVDGHETVTGCVATAMAQAMKYYNYPSHGKGSHSYLWRPGEEELSFDYENTPFQWDKMTDTYDSHSSEESKHAVAELMLGCGISVDMHYEPGGSGAATTAMGSSLIDIFGYSPALWMPNRAFYGYDEWESMIYDELSSGHPVLYSGAGTAGGHQFICDGYREDGYFHFNWGWGGLSNGYFLLTALNPDNLGVGGGAGGFNTSQVATLGMRPAEADDKPVYLFYNTIGFTTDTKTVKADEDFRCNGEYFNYSLVTMPEGSRLGMKFKETEGSDGRYVEGPGVEGYHPDDGRNDLQIRFPDLPDGTYIITPALKVDDKWYDVRMPVGYPDMVTAVVKNKEATISNAASAEIEVTDIKFPERIYRNHEFPMTFTLVNSGQLEYYGKVTPVLVDETGKEVAESKFRPVDVLPRSQEIVTDYIAVFSALKDEDFPAGDYRLEFKNGDGTTVSSLIDINIEILSEDTRFTVSEFRLDDPNPVTTPDHVSFSYTLNCESGLYYSEVELLLFPGDGGDDVYRKASERAYLTSGASLEQTIVADLRDLKDGEYMALIYSEGKAVTDRVYFKLEHETTSLTELPFEAETEDIVDMLGRKRTRPLTPGMYIINGQKTIIK